VGPKLEKKKSELNDAGARGIYRARIAIGKPWSRQRFRVQKAEIVGGKKQQETVENERERPTPDLRNLLRLGDVGQPGNH